MRFALRPEDLGHSGSYAFSLVNRAQILFNLTTAVTADTKGKYLIYGLGKNVTTTKNGFSRQHYAMPS